MSFKFMTEKKARLLLADYMKAELAGRDEDAERIENELNASKWFITIGPEGVTTVEKRGGVGDAADDLLLPNEDGVQSYQGGATNQGSGNRVLWISIGVGVGVIGLILAIVYFVKKSKANA